jgi:hypothetical protein
MTTSPDGEPVDVDSRLAEIHRRYGPDHLVSRTIHRATPAILRAVDQVRTAVKGHTPLAVDVENEAGQERWNSPSDC